MANKCENCKADLNRIHNRQYKLADPWHKNTSQLVCENVCQKCGHRNQEKKFIYRKA
jgi:hypothetical protein